ncbi:MAG: alpha/beta fold hydrolase [Streptosporangiales bacterium]|nr:alpha/beta fold hydrolase [Streptosporangiales bacterium]
MRGRAMVDGFVATSFGRIHYVRSGHGEPLLLLHSNGNSVYEFEDVIPRLEDAYDTIAWDMPGQGDSDPAVRHLTIDDYAGCVVEVMDGLGIDDAFVAGTSIGGFVCASLATRHAARMKAVALIETMFRSESEWAENWGMVEANFGLPTQSIEKVQARINRVTPEFLERWNIDRNKAGAWSMMSVMWAIREYDIGSAARRISIPALLMFGTKGPTIATMDQFRAAVPQAEVAVLPDTGHFPMIDQPGDFVAELRKFFSRSRSFDPSR